MSKGKEFTKKLEKREREELANYALKSSERREELGDSFRERKINAPLEYRTEYHRDRDRIVWSKAFKRLQNKTQIFPHYMEDHYRRRLTHSLEVAQIATTLARALEVNEVATEAMALGHDIGHTPFGHAGEEALNEELLSRKCTDDPLPIPLYGFDHCVHGVEVVTRIEDDYKKGENGYGLNLTFDVREGILKHMYDPDTKPDTVSKNEDTKKNKRPFSNLEKVVNYPAYKQFKSNKIIKSKKGSIEAQCVYLADKLSYLLSDVEAGIRSKILDIYKLRETSLFGFIKRLYKEQTGQDIMNERYVGVDDYLRFRRAALRIFILDTIKETERRSEKSEIKSFDDVVSCGKRLVYVSDKLNKKWDEFYQNKMRKKLFKAHDVCACTFKAKKIVTDLFKAYYDDLELIPQNYRKSTEKAYEGYAECGEIIKLIKVRNYVAGMTDAFATDQHSRLFMSSEKINL